MYISRQSLPMHRAVCENAQVPGDELVVNLNATRAG
jgi:hypothetical protein